MTESDPFHPRNNIVHFKNAIIKHADSSSPIIPRDAKLFIQLKLEDDVVIPSGPLPQFKGLDHWKVDTVDIMLPISPDLFVFTVCRQEAEGYVKMGSVYIAPEETRVHDGQDVAYELISDSDIPQLALEFSVHFGGNDTSGSSLTDSYATLNDIELMVLLGEIYNKKPSATLPGTLLPPDVIRSIVGRCDSLSSQAHKVDALTLLGDICLQKFQATNTIQDNTVALDIYEKALDHSGADDWVAYERSLLKLSDSHLKKQIRSWLLAGYLERRSRETGDAKCLERAVALLERTIQSPIPNGGDISVIQYALSRCLFYRFERRSDLRDLDRSISLSSAALDNINRSGRYDRAAYLNNLAGGLLRRFDILSLPQDMDRAIDVFGEAIALTSDGVERPGYLANLAQAMNSRYQWLGGIDDLERAVKLGEKAITLLPDDHPAKVTSIFRLNRSLFMRYNRLRKKEDLDRCIQSIESVTNGLLPEEYLRSDMLFLHGLARFRRYVDFGDVDDLESAIEILEECNTLTAPGEMNEDYATINLADARHAKFRAFSQLADLHAALDLYSGVARGTVGRAGLSAFKQFNAAMKWAHAASDLEQVEPESYLPTMMAACAAGMEIYPHLSWLGLPLDHRHQLVEKHHNFTAFAVQFAFDTGDFDTALEWLEQGRSIMWGQLLQLRCSLDDLRKADPALADRMRTIASELQVSGAGTLKLSDDTMGDLENPFSTRELGGQQHRELVAQWTESVATARKVSGFERFLMPKTASELICVAQSGPIVIINPNDNFTHALILLPGASETIYVPIPDFGISDVHRLRASLASAMSQDLLFRSTNVPRAALLASFEDDDNVEETFESILGELWYKVVRPIFDILAMALPPDDVQDRLIWCPTGPLAFLPLHAAGDYTKTERGFKVYDFVVSSYIPTLSSLFDSATASNEHHPFHLTAVAVSSPQGEAAIPATHEEVAAIRSLLKGDEKSYSELMEQSASPSSVLDRMRRASWVHFACHGTQDIGTPTHSALLLTGTSRLTLSDIIQESLPSAELAFLSACQTAAGHVTLPEESVHLAAGMLLAGYKGVVATMWSIMDRDAPAVTRDVYGYLLRDRLGGGGGQPDYTEAAYALHRAVGKLRQRVGTKAYLSWVPFIHIGR